MWLRGSGSEVWLRGSDPEVSFSATPVLFFLEGDPLLRLEPGEVDSARWVPLRALFAPSSQERFWWWMRVSKRLPLAWPFLLSRSQVGDYDVWGMTWDILRELRRLLLESAAAPSERAG